jgi:hypothetical protein
MVLGNAVLQEGPENVPDFIAEPIPNIEIRKPALDIIDHALANADPYKATCEQVRVENHFLTVANCVLT